MLCYQTKFSGVIAPTDLPDIEEIDRVAKLLGEDFSACKERRGLMKELRYIVFAMYRGLLVGNHAIGLRGIVTAIEHHSSEYEVLFAIVTTATATHIEHQRVG